MSVGCITHSWDVSGDYEIKKSKLINLLLFPVLFRIINDSKLNRMEEIK